MLLMDFLKDGLAVFPMISMLYLALKTCNASKRQFHEVFKDPSRFTKGLGFLQKHGAEAAKPPLETPRALKCFKPWRS